MSGIQEGQLYPTSSNSVSPCQWMILRLLSNIGSGKLRKGLPVTSSQRNFSSFPASSGKVAIWFPLILRLRNCDSFVIPSGNAVSRLSASLSSSSLFRRKIVGGNCARWLSFKTNVSSPLNFSISTGKLESWLLDQLSSFSPGILPISAKRWGERLPDTFSSSSLCKLEKDAGKVFSGVFFRYKRSNAVSMPISAGNSFSRALSFRRNSCKFFRLPISTGSFLRGRFSSHNWRNFF